MSFVQATHLQCCYWTSLLFQNHKERHNGVKYYDLQSDWLCNYCCRVQAADASVTWLLTGACHVVCVVGRPCQTMDIMRPGVAIVETRCCYSIASHTLFCILPLRSGKRVWGSATQFLVFMLCNNTWHHVLGIRKLWSHDCACRTCAYMPRVHVWQWITAKLVTLVCQM